MRYRCGWPRVPPRPTVPEPVQQEAVTDPKKAIDLAKAASAATLQEMRQVALDAWKTLVIKTNNPKPISKAMA